MNVCIMSFTFCQAASLNTLCKMASSSSLGLYDKAQNLDDEAIHFLLGKSVHLIHIKEEISLFN